MVQGVLVLQLYWDALYCGHPPGGVTILWRICYDSVITPFKSGVDWITGIVFDKRYVILCVYMPYECHVNEADYVEKLGVLQSILSELDTTCVSILGDWNADISDDSSIFEEYTRNTDLHLNGIEAPADALCCKDIDCKNENHRIALDVYYGKLVCAMTKAGQRRARTDKTLFALPNLETKPGFLE